MLPLTENVLHVRIEYEESNLILVIEKTISIYVPLLQMQKFGQGSKSPLFCSYRKKIDK